MVDINSPTELAGLMDRMAQEAFENGSETMMNACVRSANRYRALAAEEADE